MADKQQQHQKVEVKSSSSKGKVFIVMQQDMVSNQNVRAGVFDSKQKAQDYCSGLDTKGSNYSIEEAEVE